MPKNRRGVLTIFAVFLAATAAAPRQALNSRPYLPHCKYDQDIIRDDDALNATLGLSDFAFSGKVSSDVRYLSDNKTAVFSVHVKRFFKNSGGLSAKEVRVAKTLRDGEGVRCRQVVRFRYSAIFVGRKPQGIEEADVQLTISPVPVTLSNLDRVDAATRGRSTRLLLF